jgi:aldehyde dehydrogenase (NAD+)
LIDDAEVERRIASAVDAQVTWEVEPLARAEALEQWARALEKHTDELAQLVTREVGKPISEARGEVERGPRLLRYYAHLILDAQAEVFPAAAGFRQEVERRALGTVLLITPWNFPVAIPLWKMAPALAFGNTVLFRPSSSAAVVANRLVQLAGSALPENVLAILPTVADQAERLLEDSRVAGVSFTGSSAVGRSVVMRTTARGAPVQAEMGGQNASIVLDDADLVSAATTIASASMSYAGQKCTATSRVIVDSSIANEFIPLLADVVAQLRIGDPEDDGTQVGPLISDAARQVVDASVNVAIADGGTLVLGGKALNREGWFYEPTLLELKHPTVSFAQEETFGPAASVIRAEGVDAALAIANGTRYGLAGAVFGGDLDRAVTVARRLRTGIVRVNASTAGVDYFVPFGGNGASGFGAREMGRAARDFYTKSRTILIRS